MKRISVKVALRIILDTMHCMRDVPISCQMGSGETFSIFIPYQRVYIKRESEKHEIENEGLNG